MAARVPHPRVLGDELRVPLGLFLCRFQANDSAAGGAQAKAKKKKNQATGNKQQRQQQVNKKSQRQQEQQPPMGEPELPALPVERLAELAKVDRIVELCSGTKPLYLLDTYRFEADVRALRIAPAADPKAPAGAYDVVTDATVFHPQGGGQPSDRGVISLLVGGGDQGTTAVDFSVGMVRKNADGVVVHTGLFATGAADAGAPPPAHLLAALPCAAHQKVDEALRRLAARLHSGGHLLDAAMERTVKSGEVSLPPLKAEKGYHFANGPYVEFRGTVPAELRESLRQALQRHVDSIIQERVATKMYLCTDPDELASLCFRGSWSREQLAGNGWLRVVCAGGDRGCPCGGTHIQNTADIGQMEITKLASKKGKTKVSYRIVDAAPPGA